MTDSDIDFRDLLLEVEAEATEILTELMQELLLPQMKQALIVRWVTMADEVKEQLKEQYPELYVQIMQIVDAGRSY